MFRAPVIIFLLAILPGFSDIIVTSNGDSGLGTLRQAILDIPDGEIITFATEKLCDELLDAITETYPDHPYAYNLKAALANANGKPKEALKMLELAYTKNPDDSLILSNLAATYVKQGQKDRARRAYKKLLALKINPSVRKKAEAALKELPEEKK